MRNKLSDGEYLAFLSIKYEVDPDKFFNAFNLAWETQKATCRKLSVHMHACILKQLAKKCKIKIPEGKRLRFHSFRKRFLSTCADLKIDPNTAKNLSWKRR